jgi:hypothetical protein
MHLRQSQATTMTPHLQALLLWSSTDICSGQLVTQTELSSQSDRRQGAQTLEEPMARPNASR